MKGAEGPGTRAEEAVEGGGQIKRTSRGLLLIGSLAGDPGNGSPLTVETRSSRWLFVSMQ